MFGIGGFELFIILLFAFLIFGPDKLPEMAKTLGAALNKFKQAQEEMKAVINDEVLDPDAGKKAASGSGSKPAPHATQESFAERKARYDKERAERLKRQQIDANRTAMKAEAAKKAEELEKAAEGKCEDAAVNAAGRAESVSKPMPSAKLRTGIDLMSFWQLPVKRSSCRAKRSGGNERRIAYGNRTRAHVAHGASGRIVHVPCARYCLLLLWQPAFSSLPQVLWSTSYWLLWLSSCSPTATAM